MDMTLYEVVGKANRIALGDLATSRYYAADVDEKGKITLLPVNIVTGTTKRAASTDAADGADADDEDDERF